MANTLKFKRGLLAGLPSAAVGEPLFTTDTFDLYIGTASGTQKYQKFIASGTTSQLLRGDGSLLTMPIVLSSPANGEVLKYNGTNWVNSSDAGITGSGVAGQVAYFTGATTQGGSNNLFWDATNNRLGIGTATPNNFLHISRAGSVDARISNTTSGVNVDIGVVSGLGFVGTATAASFMIMSNNTERARIFAGGNVAIGSTSDSGQRLQVTGDGYFSGSVGIGTSTPLYKLDVLADTSVEPVTTPVDNYAARFRRTYTNNNASVGARRWNTYIDTTYNGNQAFTNASGLFSYVNYSNTNSSSTVNGIATYVEPTSTSAASVIRNNIAQLGLGGTITNAIGYYGYLISLTTGTTTNVKLFQADALGSTNTITNLYGFIAESTLTNATNNYGFYGNIAAGTGRWNLYMNGTAANYLNGSLSIGTTTSNAKLQIQSTSNVEWTDTAILNGGANGDNSGTRIYIRPATNFGAAIYGGRWSSTDRGARLVGISSGGAENSFIHLNGESSIITLGTATSVRATLDASGNLGLGVTPSAWNTSYKAIDIGNVFSLMGASNAADLYGNLFLNTSGQYIYKTTAAGTAYSMAGGQHRWYVVASGTAGNTATLTANMTLGNNGNLLLGSTSDTGERLQVSGTMRVSGASTFNGDSTIQLAQPTLNLTSTDTTQYSDIAFRESGSLKAVVQFVNSAFATASRQNRLEIGGTLAGGLALVADGSFTTPNLLIASTGAATFSSSVTTGGNMNVNGLTLGRGLGNLITNSAFGAGTLGQNTSGFGNLALGYFSLWNNTSGYYNTAVGYDVLWSNTQGFENIGVGFRALYNNTTGDDNIAIGYQAGNANTTGNNNIFIGYNINGASATESNRTWIGSTTTTSTWLAGNLLLGTTTDSGYRLRVNGTSYFDDNLRFPNLKGVVFVQTGGSLLGSISMDSSNQVTIDNNGFFGLSVGSNYTMTGGNLGIGHSSFGTSATRTISVLNGTAPSTSPTDSFQIYSNDVVAGNAAPHFRTENGGIIKLYQQTTAVTSATYIGGAGTTVTDLDTFDGYTIPQIVKALRNAGLLA